MTGAQNSLDMCVKCFVEFNQSIFISINSSSPKLHWIYTKATEREVE